MGTNASMFMAISAGAQGITSVANGIGQSASASAQGDVQQKLFEMNTQMAEYQAQDAIRAGDKAADIHRQKTKQLIGSQRVNLAAQGIDIESGSALDIQNDTKSMSELDVMTIKNNAWRQAWGFKMDAMTSSFKGEAAKSAGDNSARNTLLTGVSDAATYGLKGYYYANQPARKPSTNSLELFDT